jgi:hypothetical protein
MKLGENSDELVKNDVPTVRSGHERMALGTQQCRLCHTDFDLR